jgi:hypothetical protein
MRRGFDQAEWQAARGGQRVPVFGCPHPGRADLGKSICHPAGVGHLEVQMDAGMPFDKLHVDIRITAVTRQQRSEFAMLRPRIPEEAAQCRTPEDCSPVELLARKIKTDMHPLSHVTSLAG